MASRTVTDPVELESKRLELWQERARLMRTLHAVEKEITDLEMGVVHDPHERDPVPGFLLKGDSTVIGSDPDWIPDFIRKEAQR